MAALIEAAPAQAHGDIVEILVVPLLGDLTFTVYDIVALANDERSTGWLAAQAAFTTPQALGLAALPFLDADTPPVLFFTLWTSQLSTFGIYGLADSVISTESLYAMSWAVGANVATTSYASALALRGEFAPPTVAVTELATTAPQIAVATYALASPSAIPLETGKCCLHHTFQGETKVSLLVASKARRIRFSSPWYMSARARFPTGPYVEALTWTRAKLMENPAGASTGSDIDFELESASTGGPILVCVEKEEDEAGSTNEPEDGASPDGASPDGASPDGASPDGASPDGGT